MSQNSEEQAAQYLIYYGYAFAQYACESWNYSYGEPETDNRTGPIVRRLSSGRGTQYDYPVRANKCNKLNGSYYFEALYFKADKAIRNVVCDPGFELVRGNNVVSCNLPSTVPAPQEASGAGVPDKGSIASRCNSPKCGSLLSDTGGSTYVGDPINLAGGNVFSEQVEYRGAGGSRLNFARYYNSSQTAYGGNPIGLGWSHSHQPRIISGKEYAVALRGDGTEVVFQRNATTGGVYANPNHTGRLSYTNASPVYWTYKHANGDVERYDVYGRISSYEFATGGALAYTWTALEKLGSVTDGLGRSITFTYEGVPAKLTRVTFPDQTYVDYAYSPSNQLLSATHSSGTVRQYTYVAPDGAQAKLLESVIDEDGLLDVGFTYDSQGRGKSAAKADGVSGVWLNYGAGVTTVSNPLGYQETHYLSGASGVPQATSLLVSCGAGGCAESGNGKAAQYDSVGNMTEHIDEGGVLSCATYVANRSLVSKRIDGLLAGTDNCTDALASPPAHARVTTVTWHSSKAIATGMSQPLLVTTYGLDTAGRVTTITEQPTNDATGAAGFSALAVGSPRVTTVTYDAQGYVTSVRQPRNDVYATTVYAYDGAQNLMSVTDPVGLVTTFSNYDANGRPGLITEPNGLQTVLEYDAKGRTSLVNVGGMVTTYGYTPAGRLATATLPTGLEMTFGYDPAGRLTSTTDSLGNSVVVELDLQGNVLLETVTGNGGVLAFSRQMAYDALSRVKSITKAQ
ncbi:MAG: RHS repeat protein [Burkholderiaceae bacterium]|nr:RHS repeat protein [Burkholderiaceae bacterium]